MVSRKRLVLNTTFEVATGQIKQDPITFVIDGSAIFWTTDWPNWGTVAYLAESLSKYIEEKLIIQDIYLVFWELTGRQH